MHKNIGSTLTEIGKLDEALNSYFAALAILRRMIRELPESVDLASQMGVTLENVALIHMKAHRFAEACDALREAVEKQQRALASFVADAVYRPLLANHLKSLITASRALGDRKGLAAAERQLEEFRETDPSTAAVDARLTAVVKGEQGSKDIGYRLSLALQAHEIARFAAAARLRQEALELDPGLGDNRQAQYRYHAACSAAMAGCGLARDDPPPSDDQKTELRQQALDWLVAERGAWATLLPTASNEQRVVIVKTLEHWQQDFDLAGIRDEAELAKLPEPERVSFRKFWADVDALLKKVLVH